MQKTGNRAIIPGNGNCLTFSFLKIDEHVGSIALASVADKAIVVAPQLHKYRKIGVPSRESSEYNAKVAATRYPTAPESISPNKDTVVEDMLNTLIPSRIAVFGGSIVQAKVDTRQKKKELALKICMQLPSSVVEQRTNNVAIVARKTVWIIHLDHVDIVAAAGKS